MNYKNLIIGLFICNSTFVIAAEKVTPKLSCLITSNSIANVKIGMKGMGVKKIIPTATFKKFTDGEGVSGVAVMMNGKELLYFYTGEEEDTPIDFTRKIGSLMTGNASFNCKTKDGIGPGTLLNAAAKKLGGIEKIQLTEIESREYVFFKLQPKHSFFRSGQNDYSNTGLYKPESRVTKKYLPNSIITAIEIY